MAKKYKKGKGLMSSSPLENIAQNTAMGMQMEEIATKKEAEEREKEREKIIILPELKKYMRQLKPSEYNTLKEDIKEKGIRDKILLWKRENDSPIIDGHNRYEIGEDNNIEFDWEYMHFDSIEEVQAYMLNIQFGKRNLSTLEISYRRGQYYNLSKSKHGGKRIGKGASNQNDYLKGEGKTIDVCAEKFHVGKATIQRDAVFAVGLDRFLEPGLDEGIQKERDLILIGDSVFNKKDVEFIGKNGDVDLNLLINFRKSGGTVDKLLQLDKSEWTDFMKNIGNPSPINEKTAGNKKSVSKDVDAQKSDRFSTWLEREVKQIKKFTKKGDNDSLAQKKHELESRI
ncbi:hypothetical protein E1171_02080, partial [Cytophagales bacterium RKSG123]|nr:hypothetical protein [Xanthovirga aplysinae]